MLAHVVSVEQRYAIQTANAAELRLRLDQFAPHIAEHTTQCNKTLDALRWRPTEARRIVRQIWHSSRAGRPRGSDG